MRTFKPNAFTLIELLVVISIIAILASLALPVFGGIQERGAQTKALSNAKQIGLAAKQFAVDNNGNFPYFTDPDNRTGVAQDSNRVLQTLIPDYISDKSIFSVPKSAYCKKRASAGGGSAAQVKLDGGDNEWAYVVGFSDTSNARFPLLADGFARSSTYYVGDEAALGGVWKGRKAVVVRVDVSGTVEVTKRQGTAGSATAKFTVKKSDDEPNKDAFKPDPSANPPWSVGDNDHKVLNPIAP